MNSIGPARQIAERVIRASCRRLPEDEGAERCKEWSAELPAILGDTSVRLPVLRAVRALTYSAGVSRTARYLRRARGSAPDTRASGQRHGGATPARLATPARRLVLGVVIWLAVVLAVVVLLRAFARHPGWPLIAVVALGAAFDACCLVDIARARQVRHLPKWAWALICLAQTPSGGIAYLCAGRARPAPPVSAQRP